MTTDAEFRLEHVMQDFRIFYRFHCPYFQDVLHVVATHLNLISDLVDGANMQWRAKSIQRDVAG